MERRLEGRTAIVTGGARGMGEAHVRALAAAGARVLCTDVLEAEGLALAKELGDTVAFFRLDVSDRQQWQEAVRSVETQFGRVSILVNNAGIFRAASIEEMAEADYRKIIDINQTGVFLGMQAVIGSMRRAGGGSIVNISSSNGFAALPHMAAYTASKFAVRGMTKVAALEFGKDNVRVNSIHPGAIKTPMLDGVTEAPSMLEKLIKLPIARLGTPEEVANLMLFLVGDESSYCTGSEFIVDGGYLNLVGPHLV